VPVQRKANEVGHHINDTMSAQLFREIQNENWAMVESILDKYPELAEAVDPKTGELALHKIARHNGAWTLLIDMVLVLYPKALIHRDNMGALPLHHAAAHDNLAALEIIYCAYKECINEVDKMGRLPIHVAATYDAVDAIKFLLSKSPEGAYTMVYRPPADSGGGLPLHIACANHASIGVITALLAENFASAKRADENGDLPLHLLLRCGEVVDPVVVKTLLTCFSGALSRTDMHGDLPLSIAIKCQCRSAVINAVLMQHPEAAGVLNGDGHSPLFLAFKHNADDRTIMGLLNHAPDLATAVDRKTGLLPIQVATENEHSHFIVHNLLKRDLPIDMKEKVRAQLVPHHYSWNHVVSNTDDLYHQVITKVLQSCTQPQVLALAHVEGPDGKIALASATPVCKHEMRVMLRLFNTLEVVNQRPAYTNPVSDTQIFYALRYDPPQQSNGQFTILHEEKKDVADNDYLEDFDDHSQVSAVSRHSLRSTLTSRSQQTIEEKLRHIRKEKGQQVIAKLTSRSDVVERELKIRKDYHLSRHYVPAIISVHHTVQHAAYSEAMAEPGYCITMEGADTTAENLMLDMRKSGKRFPAKALKRIGISLLHMHEHGIIHADFGTHNIGKFGSRWKLLGVGGSVPIGEMTDPGRGFYHPPESIVVDNKRVAIGKKNSGACVVPVQAEPTYDIWAYGVVLYEAIAGVPLAPYACRGKRAMSTVEIAKIGMWDDNSIHKALKHIPDDDAACDLLLYLLHPDPNERMSSMRQVLEHPFFTGGTAPTTQQQRIEQRQSPNSIASSPSRTSHSTSAQSNNSQSLVNHRPRYGVDPMPAVKAVNSMESIENRENQASRNTKRLSDPESPGAASTRSGRSFGGFRKLRSSLRRQNA
jgi:serine/threonine protein kinase